MAQRLTWQNVVAPDVSQALYGTKVAGDLFAGGFEGLGDVARGIRERQRTEASNAAITAGLGVTDAAQFERMLASGGFNLDPGNVNQAALDWFTNRSGQLLDNDQTRTNTDRLATDTRRIEQDMSLARSREARDVKADALDLALKGALLTGRNLDNAEAGFDFDLKKKNQEVSDATTQATLMGQNYAHAIVDGTNSKEDAALQIQSAGLGKTEEKAAYDYIDQLSPTQWDAGAENYAAVDTSPDLQMLNSSLGTTSSAIDRYVAENPNLRYHMIANQGTQNPAAISAVMDELVGNDPENPKIANWRSTMNDYLTGVADEYGLSKETVAAIAKDNLRGQLLGSNVKLAQGRIDGIAKTLSDKNAQAGFNVLAERVEQLQATQKVYVDRMATVRQNAAMALRRQNVAPENMEAAIQAAVMPIASEYQQWLDTLPSDMAEVITPPPVTSGPGARMLEESSRAYGRK